MFENTVMKKGFPANLFYDVTKYDMEDIRLPNDFYGSLMYSLFCLPERSAEMVLNRYRDGMSFRKIGETYGISGARAESVVSDGIEKMRETGDILTVGIHDIIKLNKVQCERSTRAVLEKVLSDKYYRKGYEAGYKAGKNKEAKSTYSYGRFDDMEIAELNLSIRSYNALDAAGIHTVSDVINHGSRIDYVDNLGKKSIDEIIHKLAKLGVPVRKHFNRVMLKYEIEL